MCRYDLNAHGLTNELFQNPNQQNSLIRSDNTPLPILFNANLDSPELSNPFARRSHFGFNGSRQSAWVLAREIRKKYTQKARLFPPCNRAPGKASDIGIQVLG
ncbi:hypothetical protein OAG32_03825, partial [Akkermansiaceae bacterium]|nr:hypothetical protein [Akkermansiaceae bacterium]